MSYELTYIENNDHLQILFSGRFIDGDVLALWREIVGYLETHCHKRILIEEQPGTVGQLKTLEVFEAARFIAESRVARGTKIALLYQAGVTSETYQQAVFGETVAVNRGLFFRVFNSPEAASNWLFFNNT